MFCALFDHLANVHAFYLHRVIIAIDGLITQCCDLVSDKKTARLIPTSIFVYSKEYL